MLESRRHLGKIKAVRDRLLYSENRMSMDERHSAARTLDDYLNIVINEMRAESGAVHQHGCNTCQYLGTEEYKAEERTIDIYVCYGVLGIAFVTRFDSKDSEYQSMSGPVKYLDRAAADDPDATMLTYAWKRYRDKAIETAKANGWGWELGE